MKTYRQILAEAKRKSFADAMREHGHTTSDVPHANTGTHAGWIGKSGEYWNVPDHDGSAYHVGKTLFGDPHDVDDFMRKTKAARVSSHEGNIAIQSHNGLNDAQFATVKRIASTHQHDVISHETQGKWMEARRASKQFATRLADVLALP